MTSRDIRGVVFDLDGTLYESSLLLKLRVSLILWSELSILRHVGGAREWVRPRTFESERELSDAYHAELGRRSGIDARIAARWFEHRFMAAFIRVLERHSRVRPGLVDAISGLQSRGIKLAVLSDYGRVAERLEALRIPVTLFDELLSSQQSGRLKPAAEPFAMAAEKLDLSCSQVLMIGDRDDMDGTGARAAGMPFVGVGSPDKGRDFMQLPDLLDHLHSL